MSLPGYIKKTLVMKPEVNKIFDDLDQWLDHCRFELINFDQKDLYKSKEYKEWSRRFESRDRRPRKEFKSRNHYNNG